jgi:hypothetical protein
LAATAAAFLLAAGGASAAAPGVSTDAASSISPTNARLNGAVNPGGKSTNWYFQFGTSTSYGTNTATQNAGSGTKAKSESIAINGLHPGTSYDFRIVASNASGTSFGANQSFVTFGPPAAQTQTSQSVNTSAATLVGAVNPGGLATSWYFEYGTTTSYGSRTATEKIGAGTSTLTVSAPLANLAPGTTYHFRLVATSSAGTSYGADASFATSPALSLKANVLEVVHGNEVALSGVVTNGAMGVSVTISSEPYGTNSFTTVGTTLTRTGGAFVFYARPHIGTTYVAGANGGTSQTVAIGVRPSVSLVRLRLARLETHVSAGVQLVGRQVKLQRLEYGHWVTLKQFHLNANSSVVFKATELPHGHSTIRIALSVNEAGPGLLAGFSRELSYRRS